MLEHVHWLGHDTFRIDGSSTIYVDPWKLGAGQPPAHGILVTHDHYDHFSPDDIAKVAGPATVVVGPSHVTAKIRDRLTLTIHYGETLDVGTAKVTAVPAYNVNKFKKPGVVYHPRDEGHVGYIIDMDGVRIYHAGDTDVIPEMQGIEVDVALLPVSGTYTMTAGEAAEACTMLKAAVAVPMHFGDIVGSDEDAQRLKRLCRIPVAILDREGS
jgi:L-ascorbate metabolism protein UlaG (beta-lactamase superfamily)